MKFHLSSKTEITHVAIGTAICDGIMLAGLFLLSRFGIGTFDYRIFTGAVGGSIVAILNFAIMCLTIQSAVHIREQKQRKAYIQGSYNGRLLLQAAWVIAAFLIPHLHLIAAALPLLFPTLTILCMQKRGELLWKYP